MTQEEILQAVSSALNVAAALLPALDDLSAVRGDMDALTKKFENATSRRNVVADELRKD